jgi:adenosylhomocysteine nucleosidase
MNPVTTMPTASSASSSRPIAIMSAMHEELAAILALLQGARATEVAGRVFWQAHWHGHAVVAVQSRIGKVAAATTATVLIERFGVHSILFTGVAGGLGTGVRVGDVVVGSQFVQHDMDCSPLFPRFELPLYGQSELQANAALVSALSRAAAAVLVDPIRHVGASAVTQFQLQHARVHQGLILSGDRFVSTTAESLALQMALPTALAVEMEGAAVAQVCHDYGLPFAAVRTISDRADDAAHGDFGRFVQAVASRYSAAVVSEALVQLLPS